MEAEHIDISANWETQVRTMLELLPLMDKEGTRRAHEFIVRCAKVADRHVEIMDQALGVAVEEGIAECQD